MKFRLNQRSILLAALLAASVPALQGCFPMVAGGVAVGVLAAVDRRTVGTQTEDESIEWKTSNRISDKHGNAHVNVTSYNRHVLLTGEVPSEEAKAEIAELARTVDNVVGVWDELRVAGNSSLGDRSRDSYITSKVKARFVDANQFAANHIKVVTEAGTVFLMGLVTEREAKAGIQVTRTTDGVRKVVNVLEVISDAEALRLDRNSGKNQNPAAKTGEPAPVESR